MSEYKVAVLGGGSVGLCLAAHFAAAGAKVTLLVRSGSVSALDGKALEVSGLLGEHEIPFGSFEVGDAAQPGAEALSSDVLFVTTKAYDVADALAPFANASSNVPVLLLQNGMGSAEIAREVLGKDVPVYSSAMMIGMVREAPNRVAVTAQASPILCGPLLGDALAPLEEMLCVAEAGFIPMQHDPKIRDTIAFKLLFNSCLNPTGAITGQTYGQLLENPDSRQLIVGLADETLEVYAKAYDYRPAADGEHYVNEVMSKIVFPRSQGHQSSMLQDLKAGRKTEIDFLNGAVIRLGKSVGLDTTRHESVRSLIRACEAVGSAKAFN